MLDRIDEAAAIALCAAVFAVALAAERAARWFPVMAAWVLREDDDVLAEILGDGR